MFRLLTSTNTTKTQVSLARRTLLGEKNATSNNLQVTTTTALRFKSTAPNFREKALKSLLNSANPTNINGETSSSKTNDATNHKSKPPAFVIEELKTATNSTPTGDNEESKKEMKIVNTTTEMKPPEVPVHEKMDTTPQSQPQPTPAFSAAPSLLHEFAPKIKVIGIGGAGGNALNNMISKQELHGVEFLALNTDAQHLSTSLTEKKLQMGMELTRGLGAGANPEAGRQAAEESREEIKASLEGTHMVFITSGMGGGTGTGASPVVADICHELGILTVGVVTLPFTFEGTHRRRLALEGLERLETVVDTLITIPNQNLFRLAGPKTTFVDAFQMADDVLLGGVKSITDLMTSPGLINLDFADVQSVMCGMGNALLGTGVAGKSNKEDDDVYCVEGGDRALQAAQMALDNPLLGSEWDISTAKGMLVNITGGHDMTLFEVDQAAQCVTSQVRDENANIIFGSSFDERLDGSIRVSVVATGIEGYAAEKATSDSNSATGAGGSQQTESPSKATGASRFFRL